MEEIEAAACNLERELFLAAHETIAR